MDLTVKSLSYSHPGADGKTYETTEITTSAQLAAIPTTRKYVEYETTYGGYRRSRMVPRKESPAGKTRVYVSIDGEGLWDDFERRTSRPHTLWAPVVKAALLERGWPAGTTLRWSQKAGCSCPCSPAFFVTGGPVGYDIWITLTGEKVPVSDNLDEVLSRREQINADPTLPVKR